MGWTQPICQRCWGQENPGREAHVLTEADPEMCCICGGETVDGIYVRKDPKTVAYPAAD